MCRIWQTKHRENRNIFLQYTCTTDSQFRRFRNNAAIIISSYSRETIGATVSTPRVLVIMANGLIRIPTTMASAALRLAKFGMQEE